MFLSYSAEVNATLASTDQQEDLHQQQQEDHQYAAAPSAVVETATYPGLVVASHC